jgi:hypothetical protein
MILRRLAGAWGMSKVFVSYLNGIWQRRWIVLLGASVAAALVWLVVSMGGAAGNLDRLAVVQPALPAGSQFNYLPPSFNEMDEIESRIFELEAKLRLLLSQYTDKHPEVVSTRRQLDELLRKHPSARRLLRQI